MTRTEKRTQEKKTAAAADRQRRERLDRAKATRDKQLGVLGNTFSLRQGDLRAWYAGEKRKVWAAYREQEKKLTVKPAAAEAEEVAAA